ncbi:MAG: restriction endonuclease subunit S [Desulfobacterales bacterium]|nr:restriction endonuclease subunit S [Desulfobacterales bacterium]
MMRFKYHPMKWHRLKDIVDLRAGHPFRGGIVNTPEADVYVVQMKNVAPDEKIRWSDLTRTEPPGQREPDFLKAGQILFLARGNSNFAVFLEEVPGRAVCSPHFYQLSVRDETAVSPEFLAWQINQDGAQTYFSRTAEGSFTNSQSIRRGILEDLPVAIPDMKIQELLVTMNRTYLQEEVMMHQILEKRRIMLNSLIRDIFRQGGGAADLSGGD